MLLENHDTVFLAPSTGSEPLTEVEAAARLGLKVATLRAWRHPGRGPAFVRLGRTIRYLANDVDDFMHANRHTPASQSGGR